MASPTPGSSLPHSFLWTLFAEGLTRSTTSMVSNAGIMSDDSAIRVKGLGKKHTLGGLQEKYLTLRDAIVNFSEGAVQPCSSF